MSFPQSCAAASTTPTRGAARGAAGEEVARGARGVRLGEYRGGEEARGGAGDDAGDVGGDGGGGKSLRELGCGGRGALAHHSLLILDGVGGAVVVRGHERGGRGRGQGSHPCVVEHLALEGAPDAVHGEAVLLLDLLDGRARRGGEHPVARGGGAGPLNVQVRARRCARGRAGNARGEGGGRGRGRRGSGEWFLETRRGSRIATYPVACWRPSMPSATRSFCTASTSRPVVPSYKSRSRGISRPPGAVYGDVRVLGDGFQLLGVPLGPAAAARADRRATTARCRNGAIPERASRAFGSLCRIALLAPVNAGAAESDAMVRTLGRRRRPRLFFSRGSAAQRPCLPLPRAGLVHVADSNLGSIASNAPNNSFFESPEWAGRNPALTICPYEFEVRDDRLFLNAPPSDSWGNLHAEPCR